MVIDGDDISYSLNTCNCTYKGQFSPFFFLLDHGNKFIKYKVMLITLTPTYQAVTRPVTSVRFFGVLCLSLFGLNPETDDISKFFLDNLYWTHVHKCYFDDYWKKRAPLPDNCCQKYLKKEISFIKPELIIILGKDTMEKISNTIPQDNDGKILGCSFIYREFPKTGMEEDFVDVRKELIKFIPQVDIKLIPPYFEATSNRYRGKLGVHLHFEIKNLEKQLKMIKDKPVIYTENKDIDERWYTHYLIPAAQRGSFIVNCFSFIEYNIKPLCLEAKIDLVKKPVEDLFSEYCRKKGSQRVWRIKLKV